MEGWRRDERWICHCQTHVPHLQTFKSGLLWKPLGRVNVWLYLFTFLSPWGLISTQDMSPVSSLCFGGSALTLSSVLQVQMTMPSLVLAFRLMTPCLPPFLNVVMRSTSSTYSCPYSPELHRMRWGRDLSKLNSHPVAELPDLPGNADLNWPINTEVETLDTTD